MDVPNQERGVSRLQEGAPIQLPASFTERERLEFEGRFRTVRNVTGCLPLGRCSSRMPPICERRRDGKQALLDAPKARRPTSTAMALTAGQHGRLRDTATLRYVRPRPRTPATGLLTFAGEIYVGTDGAHACAVGEGRRR